jgi:predicted ATP-binding protein involved in virulence
MNIELNNKYVKSIEIDEFDTRSGKGLLHIDFNNQSNNLYNIIASTNGGGKTLILEKLYDYLHSNNINFFLGNEYTILDGDINSEISKLDEDQFLRFKNAIEHFSSTLLLDNSHIIKDLMRSDKLSKIVRILLKLVSSNISILLWDNIEQGLHIDYQRKLLWSIKISSPNTQVICTTQSPGIIMEGYFDCVFEISDYIK